MVDKIDEIEINQVAKEEFEDFHAIHAGHSNKGNTYTSELEIQEEIKKEDEKKRDAENSALSNIDADLEGLYKRLEELDKEIADNEAAQAQARTNIQNLEKDMQVIDQDLVEQNKALDNIETDQKITMEVRSMFEDDLHRAEANLRTAEEQADIAREQAVKEWAATREGELSKFEIDGEGFNRMMDLEIEITEMTDISPEEYPFVYIDENGEIQLEEIKGEIPYGYEQAKETIEEYKALSAEQAEYNIAYEAAEKIYLNKLLEIESSTSQAQIAVITAQSFVEDQNKVLDSIDTRLDEVNQKIEELLAKKAELGELLEHEKLKLEALEKRRDVLEKNKAEVEANIREKEAEKELGSETDKEMGDLNHDLDEQKYDMGVAFREGTLTAEDIENYIKDNPGVDQDMVQEFLANNPDILESNPHLKIEGLDRENGSFANELDNDGGIKTDVSLNSAFASAVQGPSAAPTQEPAPSPDFTQKQDYSPNSGMA